MDLQNKGLIRLGGSEARDPADGRTLIVTGVARSGTSMITRVLDAAGVSMGQAADRIVLEDPDFARLLDQPALDPEALDGLSRRRDAAHAFWGFERPQLYHQGPAVIDRFRNPCVIVTVRDPVAIAERYAIADGIDPETGLSMAMDDLQRMVRFAGDVRCPVLLVSYEKALQRPERFIDRLLEFCGLQCDPIGRGRLMVLVEPGCEEHAEDARRSYGGYIDGFVGSILTGWAYQRSLRHPLTLTVFRDDEPVASCLADRHRQDLQDCGIDDGRHGFSIDLAGHGFQPGSRVTVRVKDRPFALNNSGTTAAGLGYDRMDWGAGIPWMVA